MCFYPINFKNTKMQLSVIILNYNVQHFLELCILSVQEALQNIDSEIIVIDNNSSDESCLMIKNKFPSITLIENKENLGFPKGNNIGVSVARGKYICILNPDTVVANDTFTKIFDFALNQENLGIIGCRLIDGKGNFLPESKRDVPTPWVALTKVLALYKIFPKSSLFNRYYAGHLSEFETGKVSILVGAFMFLERELYTKVGGFDENCFMYSDDIDLSYSVLLEKKQNFYFHNTTVIHYKGESTLKDKKYMKRFQEAMNFFYKKHFKVSLFFSVFMQIGITFFAFIKMIKKDKQQNKEIDNYILISENENLKFSLQKILKKKIEILDIKRVEQINKNTQTEIIFDNNCINFDLIIKTINCIKAKNITFKIIPKNSNFMIGSNSSIDRGEFILIEN